MEIRCGATVETSRKTASQSRLLGHDRRAILAKANELKCRRHYPANYDP